MSRSSGRGRDQGRSGEREAPEEVDEQQRRLAELRLRRSILKRKAERAGGAAKGGVEIPRTGGAPLAGDTRKRMEGQLGADLSGVKLHTGGESAEAARTLGARAFTDGADVHFGAGQFAPGSREGDRLLAHELTHVVQAQKTGIQRKADEEDEAAAQGVEAAGPEVSDPDEPAEKEADAVGDEAAANLHGRADDAGAAVGQEAPGKTIARELDGVGRKIYRTGAEAGGAPATSAPAAGAEAAPPPVFDVDQIAKGQNIRVGNLLSDPGPGHAALQGLAAGDPNALSPLGVGTLPAGFPTNGVEWGLGQLGDGRCFVIRGQAGAVDWSPFPGVTPLAHSHPLRPIASQGGKTVDQVFADQTLATRILPSNSDIRMMAQQGVPLHLVHTPYRFEAPNKVDNPSGATDRRPTVSFAIRNARPAGHLFGNSAMPKYQCDLVAEATGNPFWHGSIQSAWHPHLGDMLGLGALP